MIYARARRMVQSLNGRQLMPYLCVICMIMWLFAGPICARVHARCGLVRAHDRSPIGAAASPKPSYCMAGIFRGKIFCGYGQFCGLVEKILWLRVRTVRMHNERGSLHLWYITVSWVNISWFASQPRKFNPPKNTRCTVFGVRKQIIQMMMLWH